MGVASWQGATSAAGRVAADWTWTGDRFEAGVGIALAADGTIAEVLALSALGATPSEIERLPHRALLPAFVDTHSHAFQRGLRGQGERYPKGQGNFWTWREAMYDLVARLDAQTIYDLSLQAFREMLAAGIATVGEFHYVHHAGAIDTLDATSLDDFSLDEPVLAAADDAGIRLVLLETYYRTGGVGKALEGGQKRFSTPSIDGYWRQMDALAARLRTNQTLGAVAHSLRAAEPPDIAALYAEARRRGLVFHIHVEEQRKEIEDVVAVYGRRPMDLLLDACQGAEAVTAIHCTHTTVEDLERFFAAGGTTCVCPTTEGNLGDGFASFSEVGGERARLALGSDSNARISMLEEMRWLEFAQRLATETRGALRDDASRLAPVLLRAGSEAGARALGVAAGRIEQGQLADLLAIDLETPSLAGWEPQTLLESLIFGAGDGAIARTMVGGVWR